MSESGLILLVDDNPDDREAAVRSLRKNNLHNPVHCCHCGEDALDFLLCHGKYKSRQGQQPPVLLLLDLNMPGLDGRQLLKKIRQYQDLQAIPTVVLTTSSAPSDVEDCYRAGANTFIQKPIDFASLNDAIKILKDYWFGVAILPEARSQDVE